MLTRNEIAACVANLKERYDAARQTLEEVNAAYNKVVSGRLCRLVANGMSVYAKPKSETIALYGKGVGRTSVSFDGNYQGGVFVDLKENPMDGDWFFRASYISPNSDYPNGRETFEVKFPYCVCGKHGSNSYQVVPLGYENLSFTKMLVGADIPDGGDIASLVSDPKDVSRLVAWNNGIAAFERRVRLLADLIDPLNRMLCAWESHFAELERKRDEKVLSLFGVNRDNGGINPLRLKITITEV